MREFENSQRMLEIINLGRDKFQFAAFQIDIRERFFIFQRFLK